jgi:DNA-binding CsgD family transcriptional regulator
MEFKQEELIEREIEIAGYLARGFSLRLIGQKTSLSKKLVNAHISNMMEKLRVKDLDELLAMLKQKTAERYGPGASG